MASSDQLKSRSYHILLAMSFVGLVLLGRSAQLQLIDSTNRDRAEAISIEKKIVYPARGLFFDRDGDLLVSNTGMYDLMVTVNRMNPKMDTMHFCRLVDIDKATFIKNLTKDKRDKRFSKNVPFTFITKISPKIIAKLQESLYEFPGFAIRQRNIRTFPRRIGSGVLGYINEVNEKQMEKEPGAYEQGDYIGATGIERYYEKQLRGTRGINYLLQDHLGRIVGDYKEGELDVIPQSGKDLVLSLDADLQELGEKLMRGKRGSIVAIEPKTGEILAMVSAPTFDPNLLAISQERGNNYMDLLNDPDKPLFDRSVQAQYPPGSIFKLLVGLIGLQEGVWQPTNGVGCRGGYFMGRHRWGCHSHASAGDLSTAIQHSCNTYFFTEYRAIIDRFGYQNPQIGLDSFNNYVRSFGLGAKLEVDLPSERKGNVPSSKFYDKIYPKARGGWKSPTIMSVGIGQGELELTTLQMANLAAIIANRGWYKTPHLVKAFKDGTKIEDKFRKVHATGVAAQYFEYAHEGMARVVTGGTGRKAAVENITVCGKTGTSQNPHGEDHSVFFAFAPRENPQIAIAVFVENGGWGASFGAPMSSLMIEQFINKSCKRQALVESLSATRVGLYGKIKALPPAAKTPSAAVIAPSVPPN
jgi:penicillin-binding protein 2